ncbi:hypothetical protein [Nisaea sp.]|uniref:hypothetical protein n=1 Tax=Nisaea sp. TaxID=2024842 RepID=UPI0032638E75
MAASSLKRQALVHTLRRILPRAAIVLGLMVMVPTAAYAALAVVDPAAITKLAEQYKTMKEQLEAAVEQIGLLEDLNAVTDEINEVQKEINGVTKEINDVSNDTFDAIGGAGSITVPTINLEKLVGNLNSDVICMLNRLDVEYPTLGFENLNFGSICAGRSAYKKALFVQPDQERPRTWAARSDELKKVHQRRRAVAKEAAVSGLSMAKLNTTDVPETNGRAVQELQSSVSAATTQNQRLAVIAQGIVLLAQLQVQTNQMQAKLLEIEAASLMGTAVPPAPDDIEEGLETGDGQ